jgi:hypothetical protein
MKNGKLLHSVLRKDDKNYAVNLNDWGNLTLLGAELVQFKLDIIELTTHLHNSITDGDLTVTPINETLTTESGHTITVTVGFEFSQTDNYTRPELEVEWYQKMSQDPNIIKFNDREIYT